MNNKLNPADGKTLADDSFDPVEDGYKVGLRILKILIVSNLILHPDFIAIALIDYLKISPTILLNFLSFFVPILISMLIARIGLAFYWVIVPLIIAYVLLSISLPIFVTGIVLMIILEIPLRLFFRKTIVGIIGRFFSKFLSCFELLGKIEIKLKKTVGARTINRLLFGLTLGTLFLLYLTDNHFSNNFLPSKNKDLEIRLNLHYFCQLTGTYNKDECAYWLNEKSKFKNLSRVKEGI